MSLGSKPETTYVALTATAATTVQAVPAAGLNRYIKHIRVTNAGAATTFSLGLKAGTTAPASGDPGLIALTQAIAPNSSVDLTWGGDGLLVSNAGALNLNGSAALAQVSVAIMAVLVAA